MHIHHNWHKIYNIYTSGARHFWLQTKVYTHIFMQTPCAKYNLYIVTAFHPEFLFVFYFY